MYQHLCPDLLCHIISYLSWSDVAQLRQVSRVMLRVTERVWEQKLSSDFSLYLSYQPRKFVSAWQEYNTTQKFLRQAPAAMSKYIRSLLTDVNPELIGDYLMVSLYYPSPPFNVLKTEARRGVILHDIVINRINDEMYDFVPPHIDCLLVSYQYCDRDLYQGLLPKIGLHLAPKSPKEFFGHHLCQALNQEGLSCKESDHIFDMSVASDLLRDIESRGYIMSDNSQHITIEEMKKDPHLWIMIDEC